ncbi:MAG: DUF4845 domain-containing protein [Saezia sp.]
MSNKNQKGMSLLGMVFTVIILALTVIFMMKLVPAFAEYRTVCRVAQYAAQGTSEADVKRRYDTQIRVDGVTNPTVKGSDLDVKIVGNSTTVSFEYRKEISLIGDSIFLLVRLNGQETSGTAY